MKSTLSKLGDAIDVLSGFAYEAELFNETEGLPVIRIRDVVRGFSNTRYAGEVDDRFVVKNGEILIGMDGNFNVARWTGGPALLNQRVCKVTARADVLDDGFLFHLLPKELKRIEDATAFVTVKHLSVKSIRDIDIALPPLSEQRRIAAILDQADALRAKRREALVQLDSLTQSIFIEMFGDPSVNPKAWPTKRLADLIVNGDAINYGVVQPGDDVDEGVPLVRVGDLIGGRVNHDALKRITPEIESAYKRSRLHGDEVLVSCVGTIGVVVLASESEKGFNIARAVARIRLSADNCREFIAAQLQTEGIQRYFTSELRTVSQPTLNIKQICETQVMQPPLKIQLDFYTRIKSVEALKASHIAAMRKLDMLFSSLQHSAFRGEI